MSRATMSDIQFGRTVVRPAHRAERTQWDRTKRRLILQRKFLGFFEGLNWLKLAGGAIVGVYGAFSLFAIVVAILGMMAGYAAAPVVLLFGLACGVFAAFGVWVFRSAE